MRVNFSTQHCLSLDYDELTKPNTLAKDNNWWVGVRLCDNSGIWFSTSSHPSFNTINHYNLFNFKQHPPKTVVSMVQE